MRGVRLLPGDCLEVLRSLRANSVDSCVTDPPYGLSFMGKHWDHGVPGVAYWEAALRVLKPGAHLLALGGTRTFHRLACAIEDAGFEVRDTIMWVYGSGFPKSHDVSKGIDRAAGVEREKLGPKVYAGGHIQNHRGGKQGYHDWAGVGVHCEDGPAITPAARQWEGWGTALKPACEPIVVARKPLSEGSTVAANVLRWGTGAINVDGCRVVVSDNTYAANCSGDRGHAHNRSRDMDFAMGCGRSSPIGRWPANVIHDGSEEVLAGFPDAPGAQSIVRGTEPSECHSGVYSGPRNRGIEYQPRGDSGSAARFFYCAKANKKERAGSKHPTVKPLKLMRYLVRLVTPPKGTVLDPFAGTGTTGAAAHQEGFKAILIEREKQYQRDIRKRMAA
jgi:DNA modification methylase